MEKWPIGVFASIDAGLGVQLDVAHELRIPTIHLHAPHAATRTRENADRFQHRLRELGIRITCVFGGFEGESYADIPTVTRTIGLVPSDTRAERVAEMKAIADFARLLDVDVVALHVGAVPGAIPPLLGWTAGTGPGSNRARRSARLRPASGGLRTPRRHAPPGSP